MTSLNLELWLKEVYKMQTFLFIYILDEFFY